MVCQRGAEDRVGGAGGTGDRTAVALPLIAERRGPDGGHGEGGRLAGDDDEVRGILRDRRWREGADGDDQVRGQLTEPTDTFLQHLPLEVVIPSDGRGLDVEAKCDRFAWGHVAR